MTRKRITYTIGLQCLDTNTHVINRIPQNKLPEEVSQDKITQTKGISDVIRNRVLTTAASQFGNEAKNRGPWMTDLLRTWELRLTASSAMVVEKKKQGSNLNLVESRECCTLKIGGQILFLWNLITIAQRLGQVTDGPVPCGIRPEENSYQA